MVFRVRAYRNAARIVDTLPAPAESILREKGEAGLVALPGIGWDLAGKIREVVDTAKLGLLEDLRQLPEGLVQMMPLPGVGPRRAKILFDTLKVETLDELERAARDGRLQRVTGFGPPRAPAVTTVGWRRDAGPGGADPPGASRPGL